MRLQNLVYLIIVAGHLILKVTHAGLQDILKLLALFVVAGILCLLVRLVMAAFLGQRLVIHDPHVRPDLLGRPLLFPAKLSHARRFPASERYNYWYDYFMVGVPVGFRGRIGNLISIDNQPTSESILEKCWFTIDPAYYLEPGSGDRTLEEKLNIFLHNLVLSDPCLHFLAIPSLTSLGRESSEIPIRLHDQRPAVLMVAEKCDQLLVSLLTDAGVDCNDHGDQQLFLREEKHFLPLDWGRYAC